MKKIVFVVGIGICVMLFFLITGRTAEENSDYTRAALEMTDIRMEKVAEQMDTVVVDIKGEVHRPGVYQVDADARVHDVIELAGGLTEEADAYLINLAQKVHDEMSIIVYSKEEHTNPEGNSSGGNVQGKVRINYATQEEIETLNGIGPAKAQAIIQYREEHGFFQSPEDLLNVSGIGEKTLQNFIDQIQVP